MGGPFAAKKVPTTTHVGIDGLVDPGELGTDLVDVGVSTGHIPQNIGLLKASPQFERDLILIVISQN